MASIFRVPQSGDVWQFRMYVRGEDKHYRKSLRTRDLETALQKGREEGLLIQGKIQNGVKLFGYSLKEMVDAYISYRQRDVDVGIITAGRLITIKSQLNHLLRIKGEILKVGELSRDSVYDWRLMRREKNNDVRDVTVRNEMATINALCKFGHREGYTHFDSFNFRPLRIRQDQIGKRDTFTLDEYDELVRFLRTYVSKKECPNDVERQERLLIRDYILISSNTLLRVGEARQLVWGDVEKIENNYDSEERAVKLVYLKIRPETSKVRTARKVITRGGEYFQRLRSRQDYIDKNDLVFAIPGGTSPLEARKWAKHWRNLMEGIGITDWKKRNLTWYSLRHFGITCRIKAGVSPVDVAKMAGTSISHIENTYLKYSEEMAVSAALKNFSVSSNGLSFKE